MHLGQQPAALTFGELLTTGSTWVLLTVAVWAVALGIAATCEVCTSGRLRVTAWVPCPAGVRRGVLAVLGLVLAGVGASGHAVAAAAPDTGRGAGPAALPVPERPSGSAAPSVGPGHGPGLGRHTGRHTGPGASHTVRAGDTLWAIAESRLPGSGDLEIAELVERIHEQNRRVIGADPDHIVPGQRLALPQLPRPTTSSIPTEENR